MAKLAEHIKVSRKQGTQAGFEYWLDRLRSTTNNGEGGLPQVRELLAQVEQAGGWKKRKGEFKSPEKALAFYCNHYARELGNTPEVIESKGNKRRGTQARKLNTQASEQQQEPTTDLAQMIAEAVAQALGQAVNVNDDEDDDEDDEATTSGSTRQLRQTAANESQNTFPPPRDPDAPATAGKLWKINAEGPDNGIYLCVIDEDENILAGGNGEPITAGEAYDLIGEHIAGTANVA